MNAAPSHWLMHVPYKEWDQLRASMYYAFDFYMENLSLILRYSDFENMDTDTFFKMILKEGLQSFKQKWDGVKRGDEL